MTIVKFKFNVDKDSYNIWETANSKPSYGYDFKKNMSKQIIKICENKKFEEVKKRIIQYYSNVYKNYTANEIVKTLNKSWENIEKEYFKKLKKITGKKFPFNKVDAFLTIAPRCPYRPHWEPPAFYTSLFTNIFNALLTAGHELMHIHLHNTPWWKKVEKELGNQKTHDLKEALTELLNLECQSLWFMRDQGYPNHVKLRQYINKQWKKEKNFNKLTDNCIKWIKRNGVK